MEVLIEMAVIGKHPYKLHLTPEHVDTVKEFLSSSKYQGGLSGYIDEYLEASAKTIRKAGIKKGHKVNAAKAFRLFLEGVKAKV